MALMRLSGVSFSMRTRCRPAARAASGRDYFHLYVDITRIFLHLIGIVPSGTGGGCVGQVSIRFVHKGPNCRGGDSAFLQEMPACIGFLNRLHLFALGLTK
jgi:hypothetical protein